MEGKKFKIVRELGDFQAMSEEEKGSFDTFVGFDGYATKEILDYFMEKDPLQLKWAHSLITGVEPFLRSPAFKESAIPLSNSRTAFNKQLGEFFQLAVLYFSKNL